MISKGALAVALSLGLALLIVFLPRIRLGVVTALFLYDLFEPSSRVEREEGALAWLTRSAETRSVEISVDGRAVAADLYSVPGRTKAAAIVLTHGIIAEGKDDPRLVRFARLLARAGFVVLVPELRGMKSLRILWSDVNDITASFRHLESLTGEVDGAKIGLMGFSYGAGPTLIAAADPSIRDRVKFVACFGGYYDPVNVIRFVTTGHYGYKTEKGIGKPEAYGKWVFFMNNVDYVESSLDRVLLTELFKAESAGIPERARASIDRLTAPGRYLYDLLVNEDPDRVEELLRGTDARFRSYLAKLSLGPVIPEVRAYLIIGHGSSDPLIPYTESLRLADSVRSPEKVHLAILKLFTHVDPVGTPASSLEWLTVYLPSLAGFYLLVFDLLSQQH
jgi:fermentation-respiration switch protein FrsA (DUF1100 family)